MASKREREVYALPEIDMTPLIDAVFQLVIFFLLIMSVDQVFGIAIKFPAGGGRSQGAQQEKQIKPIAVYVSPDNYSAGHRILAEGYLKLNGEPISLALSRDTALGRKEHEQGMEYLYRKILWMTTGKEGAYDTTLQVSGEVNSYHGKIVEVIDQGKKARLKGFVLLPPQMR